MGGRRVSIAPSLPRSPSDSDSSRAASPVSTEAVQPRRPGGPSFATMLDAPVITVDDRVSFWIPNRHTAPLGLAVYADGTVIRAEVSGPSPRWPLAGSIADRLGRRTYGGLACGVVDGADAAAVAAALGRRPVLSPWDDGRDIVSLAVGVLVPGQPACMG
jgi:hypothetical protein